MAIDYKKTGVFGGRDLYEITDNNGNTTTTIKAPDISFNKLFDKLAYYDLHIDLKKSAACDILGIDGTTITGTPLSTINNISNWNNALALVDNFGELQTFYLFEKTGNNKELREISEQGYQNDSQIGAITLGYQSNTNDEVNFTVNYFAYNADFNGSTLSNNGRSNKRITIDNNLTVAKTQAAMKIIIEKMAQMANQDIEFTDLAEFDLGEVVKYQGLAYHIISKSYMNGSWQYNAEQRHEYGYVIDFVASNSNTYPPLLPDALDSTIELFHYRGFYLGDNSLFIPAKQVNNSLFAYHNQGNFTSVICVKDQKITEPFTVYREAPQVIDLRPSLEPFLKTVAGLPFFRKCRYNKMIWGTFLDEHNCYTSRSGGDISGIEPIPEIINGIKYEPMAALTFTDNVGFKGSVSTQTTYLNQLGRKQETTTYTTKSTDGGVKFLSICQRLYKNPFDGELYLIWQYARSSGDYVNIGREQGLMFTISAGGLTEKTTVNKILAKTLNLTNGSSVTVAVNGLQADEQTVILA